MPRLVGTWGGDRPRAITIPGGRITVGRKKDNNVVLDHQSVSAVHCILLLEQGQCVVRDLLSTNGTRVNGQKVTERVLTHGDMLKIGTIEFMFDERVTEAEGEVASPNSTVHISMDDLKTPAPESSQTHDGRTEIQPPPAKPAPLARPAPAARPAAMEPVRVPPIPATHRSIVKPPTIVNKKPAEPVEETPPPPEEPTMMEEESKEPAAPRLVMQEPLQEPVELLPLAATDAAENEAEEESPSAETTPEETDVPAADEEPAAPKRRPVSGKRSSTANRAIASRPKGGKIMFKKRSAPAAEEPAPDPEPAPPADEADDDEPLVVAELAEQSSAATSVTSEPEAEDPPVAEPAPQPPSAEEEQDDTGETSEEAPAEDTPAAPPADAAKRRRPNLAKMRAASKNRAKSRNAPLVPKGTLAKRLAERKAAQQGDAKKSDA